MHASQNLGVLLLVEDEALVRVEIARALRDAGWDVIETGSGKHAVVFLQSGQQIDVIFTDIQLQGDLTGWDVAEAGRASRAKMPVLYTSGNAVNRSRRVQGSLFFEKPYDCIEVVKACRRLCLRKADI